MSIKWSFSADRCFRRCQRQFFFRDIVAWHNARDPLRREAFILKQVKTLELWRGLLIHRGIELFVVPKLTAGAPIDWDEAVGGTLAIADRQLAFSARRSYREAKVTKTAAGDDYCALLPHELGQAPSAEDVDKVYDTVGRAFGNLAGMTELWEELRGRGPYRAEFPIHLSYDGANIEVQLDLLCFRAFGKPTIVEWKAYESMGGSDAHLQTAMYAWALCRSGKWHVRRPEDIELIEVQLLAPAVVRHPCSEQTFDDLEDRIYRSLEEIRALCATRKYEDHDINDFAYARNANSCGPCPFRKLCRSLGGQPLDSFDQEPVQAALF